MTPRRSVAALLLAALALLPAAVQAQETGGRWESEVDRVGRVHLRMRMERDGRDGWMNSLTVETSELSGLDAATAAGDAEDVSFRLEREAGTFSFTGDIRDGRGDGTFRFTPSDAYRQEMARLGFADIPIHRLQLFASLDVTTDTVRELQQLGYEALELDELTNFAIHGVSPAYIRELDELGYASIRPRQLVTMRIHGVTPEYVRRMRAALGGG